MPNLFARSSEPPPLSALGWRIAAVATLAAGAATTAELLRATWPLERLPLWDGAGNGWGAIDLWAALADGRLIDFLVRLNAQDKWPFGFSLLLLPFVAAGQASFESATLLPALAFALTPALLLWLAREIDFGPRGLAAGTVAGLLWLASPLPRALATVVMRESTGAALGVAALAAYLRARRLQTLGSWRLLGLFLLGLFFTKYNYFLLGGTALLLHVLLDSEPDARRTLVSRGRDAIFRGGWRSPARWLALVGALSVVLLLVGENPGNLIYGAIVLSTILLFSLQWKSFRFWSENLRAQPPALRALVQTLGIPLWLWSLSPDPIHPRNVIAFLRNRSGELPVLAGDALAFQPSRWVFDYFAPWTLGVALSLVALPFLAFALARRGARRALALTAVVGFVAVALHPMKEARFLATVAPVLMLAAALALADGLGALPRRALSRAVLGALALVAVAAGLALPLTPWLDERLLVDHRQLTADPAYGAPLALLVRHASGDEPARRARSATRVRRAQRDERVRRIVSDERVAFLGVTNELSEALLFWRSYAVLGRELDWVSPPKGLDAGNAPAERRQKMAAWLEQERPRRIVSSIPLRGSRWPDDRDYRRYNAWQVEALEQIVAEGGWRSFGRQTFREVGLRVATWVPKRARPVKRTVRDARRRAQHPPP